jgi:hypothetical protein
MANTPLFLASDDYRNLEVVRTIEDYHWSTVGDSTLLVITVDPPVDPTDISKSTLPVKTLYLLTRFVGDENALKELNSFPIFVHVLIPKKGGSESLDSPSDFTNIAWATLSDDKETLERERLEWEKIRSDQ